MSKQEWAIRDEATGEWWGYGSTCYMWRAPKPQTFVTYDGAVDHYAKYIELRRDTARIVPAPPREMTDAECKDWLRDHHAGLVVDGAWWCLQLSDRKRLGHGETPYDAIRAARRALESK